MGSTGAIVFLAAFATLGLTIWGLFNGVDRFCVPLRAPWSFLAQGWAPCMLGANPDRSRGRLAT